LKAFRLFWTLFFEVYKPTAYP